MFGEGLIPMGDSRARESKCEPCSLETNVFIRELSFFFQSLTLYDATEFEIYRNSLHLYATNLEWFIW